MRPVADLPPELHERLGGKAHVWCRPCHRTFTRDQAELDTMSFDKAVGLLTNESDPDRLSSALVLRLHCPHVKCGAPLEVVEWDLVRESHPDYPETPVYGDEYPAD
jgi:hypothetical protein